MVDSKHNVLAQTNKRPCLWLVRKREVISKRVRERELTEWAQSWRVMLSQPAQALLSEITNHNAENQSNESQTGLTLSASEYYVNASKKLFFISHYGSAIMSRLDRRLVGYWLHRRCRWWCFFRNWYWFGRWRWFYRWCWFSCRLRSWFDDVRGWTITWYIMVMSCVNVADWIISFGASIIAANIVTIALRFKTVPILQNIHG